MSRKVFTRRFAVRAAEMRKTSASTAAGSLSRMRMRVPGLRHVRERLAQKLDGFTRRAEMRGAVVSPAAGGGGMGPAGGGGGGGVAGPVTDSVWGSDSSIPRPSSVAWTLTALSPGVLK